MKEKISLSFPVIVEGKYDKIKLSSVIDAVIIPTNGFGLFRNAEMKEMLKKLSEKGIIVLTDSDGAGKVIRSHLSSFIDKDKIFSLYTPQLKGKEKRKSSPSKEGFLGVEGIPTEELYSLFSVFAERHPEALGEKRREEEIISKNDFFVLGLSGGHDSRERRETLASAFSLPKSLTANALIDALNIITTREEFIKKAKEYGYDREN